ncbi:hypothetical protein [Paraburkholderia fungorum]|nr:hypothetical protein [Paraburkholderia fungorum]
MDGRGGLGSPRVGNGRWWGRAMVRLKWLRTTTLRRNLAPASLPTDVVVV